MLRQDLCTMAAPKSATFSSARLLAASNLGHGRWRDVRHAQR